MIGVGVSTFIGRKCHDKYAYHPTIRGYCSNCGKTVEHKFQESGMNWKKTSSMAIVSTPLGLGLSSVLARNIYKCTECKKLTVKCRMPKCTGMACCGDYWDDEFCGQCRCANDNSKLYNAFQDQKKLYKVQEVLKLMQTDIDLLKEKIAQLEVERSKNKEFIRRLNEALRKKNEEYECLIKMAA
jgi:hypothetical protein